MQEEKPKKRSGFWTRRQKFLFYPALATNITVGGARLVFSLDKEGFDIWDIIAIVLLVGAMVLWIMLAIDVLKEISYHRRRAKIRVLEKTREQKCGK